MGCHIKNPKDPFEVQCLFPELIEEFSLYFHSSSGQQDLIVDCAYKENYECFFIKEGFLTAHDDDGVLKITVPDTFSKQAGRFICQKEGQLLEDSCQFPFSENFSLVKSSTSEVGLRTASYKNFTLGNIFSSEVGLSTAGDAHINPAVIIGAAVGAAVLVIFLLVISIVLFRKYKSKTGRKSPDNNTPDEEKPMTEQSQIHIESGNGGACSTSLPEKQRVSKRIHSESEGSEDPLIECN